MAWTLEAGSDEAVAAVAALAPRPEDLAHAERRRDPQRRAATLERRLLLRALAARVLDVGTSEVAIGQTPDGAPTVTAPSPLHAALASRDGWIMAVVSPHPVGADVERIEDGAHRPLDLLQPAWAARLTAVDDAAFTRAWAGAEAYLKRLGVGLDGLGDVTITGAQASWAAGGRPSAAIAWRRLGLHVFALAL